MKKISLFLMAFGLVATSCTKSEFDTVYGEDPHADFSQQFVQTFGNIDPNQDWGFGSSLMRGANAGDGDLNNTIWGNYGAEDLTNITDAERRAVLDAIEKKVTGERISEDVVFPWTAYFLQDVISGQNGDWDGAGSNGTSSSSYSFEAYCKGAYCDYPGGENNPYERHGYYTTTWNSQTNSFDINPNWETEHANYLQVTNSAHLNNYYLLRDGNQTRINETTLMTDMEYGTYEEMKGKQFRWYINCHENKHWYEYIIVTVNGNYYICFDFGCGLPENDIDGHAGKGAEHNDWDYNDWILKITPAGDQPDVWGGNDDDEYVPDPKAVRIIAEDLGNATSDFDYNDVVFDAYIENGRAYITLLAAGGTLPLYVAGEEVHAKFGVSDKTMVNTEAEGGATVKPVSYDVAVNYTEVKDIPIEVYKVGGEKLELTVTAGGAAEKIAVKTTYKWTTERQHIWQKYPKFNEYVGDKNVTWY